MRTRLALAALALALSTACGSGGEDPTEICLPGILRAIAVQGEPAPDTAGDYALFPTNVAMDIAAGGFAAFVASTTDAVKPAVVYAVAPDATVLAVYAVGDTPTGVVGETIASFLAEPLRVTADFHVLCGVTLSGGGTALLHARLDAGAIVDKTTAIRTGTDMTATGVAGTLTAIHGTECHLAEGGKVFFQGDTNAAFEAIWRCDPDGLNLDHLVATADAVGGGGTILDLGVTAIDRTGSRHAFSATLVGGDEGLYSAAPADPVASKIVRDNDTISGLGDVVDALVGESIIVYPSGAVVFELNADDGADVLDVIAVGAPGLPVATLAVEGDVAPQTGGAVAYGALSLLPAQPGAVAPMWTAVGVGAATTSDFAIYAQSSAGVTLTVYENRPAPGSAGGGTFSDVFPGLEAPGRHPVTHDGSLVFANLLSTGLSGMFWLIPECGLFTLAKATNPAPGGDTFAAFAPTSAQTGADGTVLFRAPLLTAGSGLFRQGP